MTAKDLIATSLNRKDDKPNLELALEIIGSKRTDWIHELSDLLTLNDKNIQSDCIKVLYEIGERGAADMIAPYAKLFGELLLSKNNRLVWGSMTALESIAQVSPLEVYQLLPTIMIAIDRGSVITIDAGIGILAKLSVLPVFFQTTFPLLLEQLKKCPPKQLPMYAEKSLIAIHKFNQKEFIEIVEKRIKEMTTNTQKARLNKILKKLK